MHRRAEDEGVLEIVRRQPQAQLEPKTGFLSTDRRLAEQAGDAPPCQMLTQRFPLGRFSGKQVAQKPQLLWMILNR